MSRKKKILIIFHLFFALTYLCWLLILPYAKEIISQKSQIALYEQIMEHDSLFQQLSPSDQNMLNAGYANILQKPNPSLIHELGRLFFIDTPAFALAWLFLSLAVCILLLFRINGASQFVWLLPLLVLGYAYFLYTSPKNVKVSLFPSEHYVLKEYVDPSEREALGLRESLLLGWHRFLVTEWAHEEPNKEEAVFKEQLDKGLFAFNVARLKWILEGKSDEIVTAGFTAPPSILRIACYFIWNFLFAWLINRKKEFYVAPSAQNC